MTVRYGLPAEPATITIADDPPLVVESESELRRALGALAQVTSGSGATLARGQHFVKAKRYGELWSVQTRRGGYLTLASLTAGSTTDYSARTVGNSRAARSILDRIRLIASSPSPERSLTTAQVQTVCAEFFVGARFSIPRSGV